MGKTVPIVLYKPDGERVVVGECEAEPDGTISGTITNEEFSRLIGGLHNGAYSIVPEECRPEDFVTISHTFEEIDRNARAYGWEIGAGHTLVQRIESLNPSNPFLDPNWRSKIQDQI